MLEILNRVGGTFRDLEQPLAQSILSKAVLEIMSLGVEPSYLLDLLQKAHHVFPTSIRIAAELGTTLFALGKGDQAQHFFSLACQGKKEADVVRDDLPHEEIPYIWQFSHFIQQVLRNG